MYSNSILVLLNANYWKWTKCYFLGRKMGLDKSSIWFDFSYCNYEVGLFYFVLWLISFKTGRMDRGAETPVYRCSRRYRTRRNSAHGELCCFNNMARWIQPGEWGIWFNVKNEKNNIWWIVIIGGTVMQSEVSDRDYYHTRAAINFMANLILFFDQKLYQ